jgi:hypothetical protein
MQIGGIATVATAQNERPAATRSANSLAPSTPGTATHVALSTTSVAADAISSSLAPAQNPLNVLHAPPITSAYSTSVGGKSYPLSVELSEGIFVASVPNPPGATATGATPQSAEMNLDMKLDTLA